MVFYNCNVLFQQKKLQSAPIREPSPDQPPEAASRSSNGGTIGPCNLKAFRRDFMISNAENTGFTNPSELNLKKCATKVCTPMERNSGSQLPIQNRFILPNSNKEEGKMNVEPVMPKHKPSRIPIRTKTPIALNLMKEPEDNARKPKNILKPFFSNADVNPCSSTDYEPNFKPCESPLPAKQNDFKLINKDKKSWVSHYQEQESQELKENSFFYAKFNLPNIPKKSFKDSKANAERRCTKTFEDVRKEAQQSRYTKAINKRQNKKAMLESALGNAITEDPTVNCNLADNPNDQVEMPRNPDIVEPTVKPVKFKAFVSASIKPKSSKKRKLMNSASNSKLFKFKIFESEVNKDENEEEDVIPDNLIIPVKRKQNISELLDMQPSTSKAAATITSQPKIAQLKRMPSKLLNEKMKSYAKKRSNDDENKDTKNTGMHMHRYKIPKLSANKPQVTACFVLYALFTSYM